MTATVILVVTVVAYRLLSISGMVRTTAVYVDSSR